MQPLEMETREKHRSEPEPLLVFIHRKVGKWVIIGAIAVAVIAVIVAAYTGYERAQSREMWEELAKARSIGDIESLATRYHGIREGAFVQYELGGLFFTDAARSGDPAKLEKAAQAFSTVTEDWPTSFYAPLAYLQLGCVREEQTAAAMAKSDENTAMTRFKEALAAYTSAARYAGTWGGEMAREQIERLNIAEKRLKHSKG